MGNTSKRGYKTCCRCGKIKIHGWRTDRNRLQSACIDCENKRSAEWGRANRPRRLQIEARHQRTQKRKVSIKRHLDSVRHTPYFKARAAAHRAVQMAVDSGRLIVPELCPECLKKHKPASDGRRSIHFHHTHGYSKKNQLVGKWACYDCHAIEHGSTRQETS